MEKNKTHYRKVFKSDYLSIADLEDFIEEKKSLIFTIKEVKQLYNITVGGRKTNANIAYFKENIKPMVINAKNGLRIKTFTDSKWVEDWTNVDIELYVDMGVTNPSTGEKGGVGIKPIQPKSKVKPQFTDANFEGAKKAGATIEKIMEIYTIDAETILKYEQYVTA